VTKWGGPTSRNSETAFRASRFLPEETLSSRSYAMESAGEVRDFSSMRGFEPGTVDDTLALDMTRKVRARCWEKG
jgi:hypothetical protein